MDEFIELLIDLERQSNMPIPIFTSGSRVYIPDTAITEDGEDFRLSFIAFVSLENLRDLVFQCGAVISKSPITKGKQIMLNYKNYEKND